MTMSFTCKEWHKMQVRLNGTIRPCCHMPGGEIWTPDNAFQKKVELNDKLFHGEQGACAGCPHLIPTEGYPSAPDAIDIFTNSFCPLHCAYCDYGRPGGLPDAPLTMSPDVPPVQQFVYNTVTDIPRLIRRVAEASGGKLKRVSLSGGDAAQHSDFAQIVNTANEIGAMVIYLSSGIVSLHTQDFCVEKVRDGKMFVSCSPDTHSSQVWLKIKRTGHKFGRVVDFLRLCSHANPNNVIVKMIVLEENCLEAGEFIEFWYSEGLRRFALSRDFRMHSKITFEQRKVALDQAREAAQKLGISEIETVEMP